MALGPEQWGESLIPTQCASVKVQADPECGTKDKEATGQTRRKVGFNGPAGDTLVLYVTEHGSDTALLVITPMIFRAS